MPLVAFVPLKLLIVFAPPSVVPPTELVVSEAMLEKAPADWMSVLPDVSDALVIVEKV